VNWPRCAPPACPDTDKVPIGGIGLHRFWGSGPLRHELAAGPMPRRARRLEDHARIEITISGCARDRRNVCVCGGSRPCQRGGEPAIRHTSPVLEITRRTSPSTQEVRDEVLVGGSARQQWSSARPHPSNDPSAGRRSGIGIWDDGLQQRRRRRPIGVVKDPTARPCPMPR